MLLDSIIRAVAHKDIKMRIPNKFMDAWKELVGVINELMHFNESYFSRVASFYFDINWKAICFGGGE